MSTSLARPSLSIQSVMRPSPLLLPEESVERAVRVMRNLPLYHVPVLRDGRLCGILDPQDLVRLLGETDDSRHAMLSHPIADIMRSPIAVATPGMSLREIGALCSEFGLTAIPVVDEDNYSLGIIWATDLLVPEVRRIYPGPVGGMATPFGVYLTNGTLRAGVGDGALIAAGMYLGLLFLVSAGIVEGLSRLASLTFHIPDLASIDLDGDTLLRPGWSLLGAFGAQLATTALFLIIMRVSGVAGYHAAEHQAVHAMERFERLEPDIVARMPRAHPRCGTNLWAAGMIFGLILQIGRYVLTLGALTSGLVAAFITLLVWRRVGAWFQETFTTRPATERELASGIAAANNLTEQFANALPQRTKPLRKLWCMGLVQTALGMLIVMALAQGMWYLWNLKFS